MLLKFEDYIFAGGPTHEYINTDLILRVRLSRKRIRLYYRGSIFGYIFIARTKNNMDELRKWDNELFKGVRPI